MFKPGGSATPYSGSKPQPTLRWKALQKCLGCGAHALLEVLQLFANDMSGVFLVVADVLN
jgi:hypothetical protein